VTVLKYARQYNHPIAIRGGGHSTSGASSIEDGVVVDLSRYLSGVRVDPVEKLAYVGGGAIWETVDKTAIEHGLATVGGTVNHVSSSTMFHFRPTYLPCTRPASEGVYLAVAPDSTLFTAPISAFS